MTLDALCALVGHRFVVQPCRADDKWRVRIQRAVRDRDGELVIALDAPVYAEGERCGSLFVACTWAAIAFEERLAESGRGAA